MIVCRRRRRRRRRRQHMIRFGLLFLIGFGVANKSFAYSVLWL
jgi:hypothetical protein